MIPLDNSRCWGMKRKYSGWILACFCVVGLLSFGYGQADNVDNLIRQLKDRKPANRLNAALALGRSKDPRAVEPLIDILSDKNDTMRGIAALALGMIKDPRAVEPLIAALMDQDSKVRVLSASSLGMIGDPRAVGPLTMALGDSNLTVRQEAASSLTKIRPALTANSGGPTAATAPPAASPSDEKPESDVVPKVTFTPVAPPAGKALVYFYRSSNEDPGLSAHIFANGNLLAELPSSSYVSTDTLPGPDFFNATLGPPGQGQYFPPTMRWPKCAANREKLKCSWDDSAKSQEKENHGCAQVNWRHPGESSDEDLALCQKELTATITALSDWGTQVEGVFVKKSFKPGEFLLGALLAPAIGGPLMADALPRNGHGPKVDTNWLQMCGPSPFPKLSSNEAHEFYSSPISSRGRTRCFTELLEASRFVQSKEQLTVELEEGKTYYVELGPTKMELVDAATGMKGIAGLQSIDIFNAASVGDLVRVKSLIDAKADVNAKQGDGFTALMWASGNGHLEVVRALIDAKADVNAKQGSGFTALMWASGNGHLEVVRALIDAKADVNANTTDGITALKLALANSRMEVVRLLQDAGAARN